MAYPSFSGFELNDPNGTGVITSNIMKYSSPNRQVEIEQISRRPGGRVLNSEFAEKKVKLTGYILGETELDLRDKIDEFNASVTRIEEGQLSISTDRQATCLVESFNVSENPYNNSYIPFDVTFALIDPFFYAGQHQVTIDLPASSSSVSQEVTISGSYYTLPTITITVAGGSGATQTKRIDVSYDSTGETVVWSGASGAENIDYEDILQFDFNNQLITRDSSLQASSGSFADFDPGARNITITFSGAGDWVGGTMNLSYQPRYL